MLFSDFSLWHDAVGIIFVLPYTSCLWIRDLLEHAEVSLLSTFPFL